MFARFLEFSLTTEKEEFLNALHAQLLPFLRQQPGFASAQLFFAEIRPEIGVLISLWDNKLSADRYEREGYPRWFELIKPFATVRSVGRYHADPSLPARLNGSSPTT